jgi:hypothetical protein
MGSTSCGPVFVGSIYCGPIFIGSASCGPGNPMLSLSLFLSYFYFYGNMILSFISMPHSLYIYTSTLRQHQNSLLHPSVEVISNWNECISL